LHRGGCTTFGDQWLPAWLEIGIQPHIVEAVLNHATFRKGSARPYNLATYEREMRTALALWADHLRSIIEGGERKIVSLK
jgi:hypothetical protein